MGRNRFKGRSLALIRDFTPEERLYLFEKTKEFKRILQENKADELKKFRIDNGDFGIKEVNK